jgi:cytoskeletal protein RodZ
MRRQSSTRFLGSLVAAVLFLTPYTWAQNPDKMQTAAAPAPSPANSQVGQSAPAAAQQSQGTKPSSSGSTINPSEGPLQPVTTYPDASQPPVQGNATVPNAPEPKTQQTEPQGAATAEKVPAAGGAAAKPAGVAIAPAKQHRTRSLLIKFGAVAAAGVAAGTVYALSRGTSSTPPGANGPSAVPK